MLSSFLACVLCAASCGSVATPASGADSCCPGKCCPGPCCQGVDACRPYVPKDCDWKVVRKELERHGARVYKKKVVTKGGKAIYFVSPPQWGNAPPAEARREVMRKYHVRVEALRKSGVVIEYHSKQLRP